MISIVALQAYLLFSKADGMNLRYNSWTGDWEPMFYFNLNK